MDAVKTFETSQREALSHHIENVALHLKQQKQALAMTEEGFRGIDETTNDYKEVIHCSQITFPSAVRSKRKEHLDK